MCITSVRLQDFTVFKEIDIDFATEFNVLIGENGTGKTHLMKAMYASMLTDDEAQSGKPFPINRYIEYFGIKPFNNETGYVFLSAKDGSKAVFIPAKDILTHSKGFLSLYNEKEMSFDKTYYDIISKSLLPKLKQIPAIGKSILPQLEKIIGGKVLVEDEKFFIEKENGIKIDFSLEAEGIKRIAILWQLIMNGSIAKGSILLWDEPEANINPKLIPNVVEILLELSRQGVQIFTATHNYLFAKYMEVLAKDEDKISFHALYKTDDGVKCETQAKFSLLAQNSIREENINLYEAEIEKEMS